MTNVLESLGESKSFKKHSNPSSHSEVSPIFPETIFHFTVFVSLESLFVFKTKKTAEIFTCLIIVSVLGQQRSHKITLAFFNALQTA